MPVTNKQVALNLVAYTTGVNDELSKVNRSKELTTAIKNTSGIHYGISLASPDNIESAT